MPLLPVIHAVLRSSTFQTLVLWVIQGASEVLRVSIEKRRAARLKRKAK